MTNQLHGFIEDMPNDDYHKSDGISKTGLDKIERSPAHYRWPEKRNSTRNMEIGTAIHAAILEPVRFDSEYCLSDSNKRTEKAYKDDAKIHTGELTLTKNEAEHVMGMRESVEADYLAMKHLREDGRPELSAFCTDPETGVQIRARFDWLTNDGVSVDVKKTQDLRKFGRSVADYRYHVQDAMYSFIYKQITGEDLKSFYFLAVEENSPYSCKMFELDELAKEIGQYYFRKNLRTYADCINSGKWPHKEIDGVIELSNWEITKYEEDLEVMI